MAELNRLFPIPLITLAALSTLLACAETSSTRPEKPEGEIPPPQNAQRVELPPIKRAKFQFGTSAECVVFDYRRGDPIIGLESGEILRLSPGPSGEARPQSLARVTETVTALALAYGGETLLIGTRMGWIHLLDLRTNLFQGCSRLSDAGVYSIATAKGVFFSGHGDGTLVKWKSLDPTSHISVRAHRREISSIAVNRESRILCTVSGDGLIKTWNLDDLSEVSSQREPINAISSVFYLRDTRDVLCAIEAGWIIHYSPSTDRIVAKSSPIESGCLSVDTSDRYGIALSGGRKGALQIHDLLTMASLPIRPLHDGRISATVILPGGRYCAADVSGAVIIRSLFCDDACDVRILSEWGRKEWDVCWDSLGDQSPAQYIMMHGLIYCAINNNDAAGLKVLSEALVTRLNVTGWSEEVKGLLKDLEAVEIETRQRASLRASDQIRTLGPTLRRALAGQLSPELRTRVIDILKEASNFPIRGKGDLQRMRALLLLCAMPSDSNVRSVQQTLENCESIVHSFLQNALEEAKRRTALK